MLTSDRCGGSFVGYLRLRGNCGDLFYDNLQRWAPPSPTGWNRLQGSSVAAKIHDLNRPISPGRNKLESPVAGGRKVWETPSDAPSRKGRALILHSRTSEIIAGVPLLGALAFGVSRNPIKALRPKMLITL
jgi:hypothetical protein